MNRPARSGGKPAPAIPARPAQFRLHADSALDSPWLDRAAWLAIAVFAAAALAMVFGPHSVGDVFTETDFYGSYGPGAKRLLQGHLDVSRYGVVGPLFEMLLAAVGLVVRDLFLAAELIAVVSMTVVLGCWHALIARRAGRLLALTGLEVPDLRARLGDAALHDAVAVCALFNFMNRYVEGLGLSADEGYFQVAGHRIHDVGYAGLLRLLPQSEG